MSQNEIYHEKQSLQMCALHALNNLFQGVAFTKQNLEEICNELSPDTVLLNPHKSWIGLGNYDVNILIKALQMKDCTAVWFDKRKDPKCLDLENIMGFVLNIPGIPKIGPIPFPLWKGRHWFALREIGGAYYNLDSKLSEPKIIGTSEDLLNFLRDSAKDQQTQIFLVVTATVEQNKIYLHPPFRPIE